MRHRLLPVASAPSPVFARERRTSAAPFGVYLGVVVGWVLIGIGLAIEALNVLIYHPRGMSSIFLVPPLAISLGVAALPSVPLAARIGIAAAAFLFNFRLLTPWFSLRDKPRP